MKRIAIIGAGTMGTALYSALKEKFDVLLCGRGDTPDADVVLFCVKPQDFAACVDGLSMNLSQRFVISIMAGVSLKTLTEKTGATAVVRSMPNLPTQVGKGFTAWIASDAVTEKDFVKSIFAAVGEEMELRDETQLNAITALSGSGPGYFFYFCELLEEKAREWGFSEEESKKIVCATFVGSAKLLETSDKSAGEWKRTVASKGGTTEAALRHLEDGGFGAILKRAMEQAKKRSESLQ